LTLAELRNKHMVLIDTVGVGQRDQVVMEQETMLNAGGAEIKRMLLLNATCNGSTLDDVVRAFHGESAHGCIITKTDETASLGVVLDAMVRHKLMLHYVANGQKVPEDLHAANAPNLMHLAFESQADDPAFALSDNEFSLVASGLAAIGGQAHPVSCIPRHGCWRVSFAKAAIDQAEGLRRLLSRDALRIITVVSATAGVGKTSAVINLAVALARAGREVLILDESRGAIT